MRMLMDDTQMRIAMGKAARQRVEMCFERSGMLARQAKDYANLLSLD